MLDGVPGRVPSYRLFSHACYNMAVTPNCSGRCCHSCIKEEWNLTITKTKLSRCSGKTPTYALLVIPRYRYLFRLNESHEILVVKRFLALNCPTLRKAKEAVITDNYLRTQSHRDLMNVKSCKMI